MDISLLNIYNQISIQQYKTDMGFKALVEGVHEKLFIVPVYQRKYRWSKEQVEELAASLIRDLPIPPIYTFRNEKGQLEILDGQQRVMSLYFYFIGKFLKKSKDKVFDYRDLDLDNADNLEEALESKYEIEPMHFYMDMEGKRCDISYQSLPVEIKRKVDYITISIVEIKVPEREMRDEAMHKIFTNLNSGGEQLSDQELRNGIYYCAFTGMIDDLNRNNIKWRHLYGQIDDECKDMELLYRFCALKRYVSVDMRAKKEKFIIDDYQYSIKNLIDRFAKESAKFSSKEIAGYRKSLQTFISNLNISKKMFDKISLLEGLYIVQEKKEISCQITDEICKQILASSFYKDTVSGGTISITNMNKRWIGIYELLSENGGRSKKPVKRK